MLQVIEMINANTIAAILSGTTDKVTIGLYGYCVYSSYSSVQCESTGFHTNSYIESNKDTKFLLSMHTIGLITSLVMTVIGCCGFCSHNPTKISRRQIELYSRIKKLPIVDTIYGDLSNTTTTLHPSGFFLVFIPFICTLLSSLAFYKGQ
nr:5132_t:CDS:2 [Entrophospora candida]